MKEPLSERLMTSTPVNTELFVKEVQVAPWVIDEVKRLESFNNQMFTIIKGMVINRHLFGDPHFEGVRERLIDMAETFVNEVEGER